MTDLPIEKAERIIRHYGAEKQLVILAEECSELAKEACKCMRDGKPYSADMIEEMADVQICSCSFAAYCRTIGTTGFTRYSGRSSTGRLTA